MSKAFYRTPGAIYIASKAVHRPQWREFRAAGVPIISRWIDVDDIHIGNPPEIEPIDYPTLWSRCIEDVQHCDMLIAYAHPEERLKGVLVEIGAAIALSIPVLFFGDPGPDNGTWINHPGIKQYLQVSPKTPLDHMRDYFTHHYG